MVEYIEREAAQKVVEMYGCTNGSVIGRHSGLADYIAMEIEDLPAADVVPVVRCKECKYWNRYHGQWENHNAGECYCHRMEGGTDENAFCSYGKRKEGAE